MKAAYMDGLKQELHSLDIWPLPQTHLNTVSFALFMGLNKFKSWKKYHCAGIRRNMQHFLGC